MSNLQAAMTATHRLKYVGQFHGAFFWLYADTSDTRNPINGLPTQKNVRDLEIQGYFSVEIKKLYIASESFNDGK